MSFVKILKTRLRRRYYWHKNIRVREIWSNGDLNNKASNITAKLTDEELLEIKTLWGNDLINETRIRWFELYKTIWPDSELKYFIPYDFYYMYVDEFFAKRRECKLVDDKNLYDLLFHDVDQPRTIARMINGIGLSADYQFITRDEIVSLCKRAGRVVLKISVDSEGGKGVTFYDANTDDDEKLWYCINHNWNLVIQEAIRQHSEMSKIHQESINTVRIMTFYFENNVYVLSFVVRMGVGESKLDNASSGGIVCGVNQDGRLKNIAFDVKANKYDIHPSGAHFEDVMVPNFDECLELVQRLALRLVKYTRLVSWDFAINEKGRPILIEANLSYGQVDFHQMCNGPIFGNISNKVISYVLCHNPFIIK